VIKATQVLKVYKALKDSKVSREQLVLKAHKACKEQ
jgi:hypothetical protein